VVREGKTEERVYWEGKGEWKRLEEGRKGEREGRKGKAGEEGALPIYHYTNVASDWQK